LYYISASFRIKFAAVDGSDTIKENGLQQLISTEHQCITAMREYERSSFEELRIADYLVAKFYKRLS